MDADLGGVVVVGAEPDAAAFLARDLLTPAHRERRVLEEVGPMDLGRERLEMMVRPGNRQGDREHVGRH